MANFDRFDILAAYNVYSMLWGGDGCDYENTIRVRISRLDYRPSTSEQALGGLSLNAREIYNGIVERQHATESGYVFCACCGDDCVGVLVLGSRARVPRGTDLCELCSEAECEISADECKVICDHCGEPGCRWDEACIGEDGRDAHGVSDDELEGGMSPYERAERAGDTKGD